MEKNSKLSNVSGSNINEQIIYHALEAIIQCDLTGKIISVNPACEKITGFSPEDVIGRDIVWLLNYENLKESPQNILTNLNLYGYWKGNLLIRKKNSPALLAVLKMSQLVMDQEEEKRIVCFFHEMLSENEPNLTIQNPSLITSDSITSTRAFLFNRVQHAIDLARRTEKQVAVLSFQINILSQHGKADLEESGHSIQHHISQKLASLLRSSDTVMQFDSDEYIIILENLDPGSRDGVSKVAIKISEGFCASMEANHEPIQIPSRIGISIFPENGSTSDELIKKSREAAGRNSFGIPPKFTFYSQELKRFPIQIINPQKHLQKAIDQKELRLDFQPVVDSSTFKIKTIEAFIRWHHPVYGEIAPEDFLPSIQSPTLIHTLNQWVFRAASITAQSLHVTSHPQFGISINLSQYQLAHPDLSNTLTKALDKADLPARLVFIEISEKILIEKIKEVRLLMEKISSQGIKIIIDDFGTSCSSLQILRSLPLNAIKIDKSFIQMMTTDLSALSLVQGLISIGQHLNVEIIAEGVETADQVKLLVDSGCNGLQGYYFSRALMVSELRKKMNLPLPWNT